MGCYLLSKYRRKLTANIKYLQITECLFHKEDEWMFTLKHFYETVAWNIATGNL